MTLNKTTMVVVGVHCAAASCAMQLFHSFLRSLANNYTFFPD